MPREHIVKSYDEELGAVKSKILTMGEQCCEQLVKAAEALKNHNSRLAEEVIQKDLRVDALQAEIESLTIRMLARRQPMALDLRNVVSALKMAASLERIADYATNIARHVINLNSIDLVKPVEAITKMIDTALTMIQDVMTAYRDLEASKVVAAWHRDELINERYASLLSELHELMKEDPENIKAGTTLLFVGRCCERIGDHIKNLAENVHFIINGVTYRGKVAETAC